MNQLSFNIINPQAAGIDVGTHLVAIDQNKDNVREFGVYTKDHQEMISHLHQHGVTTIAMESKAVIGRLCLMPSSKQVLMCYWLEATRPRM